MSAQGCERRWSWAGGVTKLNVAGGSQACGIAVAVRAAGVSGTGEWCRASPVQRPSAPRCPPDARAMRPPDATVCRRSQKPPELTTPKYYFLNCKYTNKTILLPILNIRVNKDQRADIVGIVVSVIILQNAIFIYINTNSRQDMNSHGLQDRQYLGSVGNMDGGRWRPSADDPGGHAPPRLVPRRLAETSHFTFLQGTVQRRKP